MAQNLAQNLGRNLGEALYVLAYLGANLGFAPLLILMLPRRVAAVAPSHPLASLSGLVLLGGVTASLAHIGSGAISDLWIVRHGSRRPVIAMGLAGLVSSYIALAQAETIMMLAVGVICFQLALNLLYAPLGALMTDYIPDARKGRVAGWLNAGLPLAVLMVPLFTRCWPNDNPMGFYAVAAAVAALVLPLLMIWPFEPVIPRPAVPATNPVRAANTHHSDLMLAWGGRLLMQLGACLLVNYLFLYLLSLQHLPHMAGMPDPSPAIGYLSFAASGVAMVGSVAAGHGADVKGFRRLPMIAAALVAAGALVVFAKAPSWPLLMGAYVVFQAALIVYLAIDSALVTQLLRGHPRRGTVLGLMNLTNTLPAIILPLITLQGLNHASSSVTLPHTIIACAAACIAAAMLVGCIRSMR